MRAPWTKKLKRIQFLNVLFTGVFVLKNMVSTTQLNTPPPPPHTATHCLYIQYIYFGKGRGGGGVEVREKVEGKQYTRGVEND